MVGFKATAKHLNRFRVLENKTNEELMRLFQRGEEIAFAKLYETYKNAIFSYILGMVKQSSVAQELAQETFLKVYKNKIKYNPAQKFTTWLWTIARHTTFDYLKKKDASRYLLDIKDSEGNLVSIEELESELSTPEIKAIEKSEKEQLDKCMQALTVQQNEAILMRIVSDLSYDEIADALEVSLSAVKSLINRAKVSLLKCIRGLTHNE